MGLAYGAVVRAQYFVMAGERERAHVARFAPPTVTPLTIPVQEAVGATGDEPGL
jgi:hypothetical protein